MRDTRGVKTQHGFIRHIEICGVPRAPVKVIVGNAEGVPYPVVRDGRYIHALPNGGEVGGSFVPKDIHIAIGNR